MVRFFRETWRKPAVQFIPGAFLVVMLYGLLWFLWLFYSHGGSFYKAGGNVEIPARDPWFFVFPGIPMTAAFLYFCVQSLILLMGLARLCVWLITATHRVLRLLVTRLFPMGRIIAGIGEVLWLLIVDRAMRLRNWLTHLF